MSTSLDKLKEFFDELLCIEEEVAEYQKMLQELKKENQRLQQKKGAQKWTNQDQKIHTLSEEILMTCPHMRMMAANAMGRLKMLRE